MRPLNEDLFSLGLVLLREPQELLRVKGRIAAELAACGNGVFRILSQHFSEFLIWLLTKDLDLKLGVSFNFVNMIFLLLLRCRVELFDSARLLGPLG